MVSVFLISILFYFQIHFIFLYPYLLVGAIEYKTPVVTFDSKINETIVSWNDNQLDKTEDFSNEVYWEAFRNKRIVFMGDSLTRYQYINIAYFLTKKKWPGDMDQLCHEGRLHGHRNFTLFAKYTHDLLEGFQLSESYRGTHCCDGWVIADTRQYYNPSLNVTVWFVHWFGKKASPHGHYNITQGLTKLDCMPSNCGQSATNHSWMMEPAPFVHLFITAQQPDFFVLNTGHHIYPFDSAYPWGVEQGKAFESALNRLKKQGSKTRVVWKTTTPIFYEKRDWHIVRENVVQRVAEKQLWEVYNVTQLLSNIARVYNETERHIIKKSENKRTVSWDFGGHYNCWVYTAISKDFVRKYILSSR